MAYRVEFDEDPAWALAQAGHVLRGEPVRGSLILSLLHDRIAEPRPGRYWALAKHGQVIGLVFQSPTNFIATANPLSREDAIAFADGIFEMGVNLPGFSAEAATAAAFAGQWAERKHLAIKPNWAGRIYEFMPGHWESGPDVPGSLRPGNTEDTDLLIDWLAGFQADARETSSDPAIIGPKMLRENRVMFWDAEGPKACAGFRVTEGVARIGPVYTPPRERGQGFGRAVVAGLTRRLVDHGLRCILYTDLANPTSNSIYRKIGYRPVSEVVRFEFIID